MSPTARDPWRCWGTRVNVETSYIVKHKLSESDGAAMRAGLT